METASLSPIQVRLLEGYNVLESKIDGLKQIWLDYWSRQSFALACMKAKCYNSATIIVILLIMQYNSEKIPFVLGKPRGSYDLHKDFHLAGIFHAFFPNYFFHANRVFIWQYCSY